MNTVQAQIATFLNVSPNQIKSCREMAWVYCVVVYGRRATFVSKKVVDVTTEKRLSVEAMVSIGGSRWTKHDKDRVYFDPGLIAKILGLSNSKTRKIAGGKFWYDVTTGEFQHWSNNCNGVTDGEWSAAIRRDSLVVTPVSVVSQQKPFPNAMMTSAGEWVSPDMWDEIESAM